MSDPRDYCESNDELAREVLDREEYGEYRQQVAEKTRVVNLARRRRNERLNDPWSAA